MDHWNVEIDMSRTLIDHPRILVYPQIGNRVILVGSSTPEGMGERSLARERRRRSSKPAGNGFRP